MLISGDGRWQVIKLRGHKGGVNCLCTKAMIPQLKGSYSCVFNTSHTALGGMPSFYQKLVCITRHAMQFYGRPCWNTEHTNSLLI